MQVIESLLANLNRESWLTKYIDSTQFYTKVETLKVQVHV